MTTKPFDLTKPVQTRSGLKARIICMDRVGEYPIIALVTHNNGGNEAVYSYMHNGQYQPSHGSLDLINIPVKKTIWVNIYRPYGSEICSYCFAYVSKQLADESKISGRIACIPVEYEE